MNRLVTVVMFLIMIALGLYLIYLMLSNLSWKLYTAIYASYKLGLLFPYPNVRTIFYILVFLFCLLVSVIAYILVKIRRRHSH